MKQNGLTTRKCAANQSHYGPAPNLGISFCCAAPPMQMLAACVLLSALVYTVASSGTCVCYCYFTLQPSPAVNLGG